MPKNVGDLGQLVIAKGFKKLPKVQKIAKSGHTANRSKELCNLVRQVHRKKLIIAFFNRNVACV